MLMRDTSQLPSGRLATHEEKSFHYALRIKPGKGKEHGLYQKQNVIRIKWAKVALQMSWCRYIVNPAYAIGTRF